MELKYFTLSEFDSPDIKGSGTNMDHTFLTRLELARQIANIPFRITSGYRTESHNKKVGGVQKTSVSKGSSHLYGCAADIAVANGGERYKILAALIEAGFRRIGIAKGFIHCDTDPDKANAVWTY
jgi:uncharacterized protein YcbK (DUF882 family)